MILRLNLELGKTLSLIILYSSTDGYAMLSDLLIVVHCSLAKHLESANAIFSFVWWIIGFYWVTADSEELAHSAPQLYWFVLYTHNNFFCFV